MIYLLASLMVSQVCADLQDYEMASAKAYFYIAIQEGQSIPTEYGGRKLGTCGAGVCTVTGCGTTYQYTYKLSPRINGWQLAEVFAHPYFAMGWYLAAQGEAGLRWYSSGSAAKAACLAHFTGQECLDLFEADERCWLLSDGRCCRYGILHCEPTAPGNNEGACPYALAIAPMPCESNRGPGGAMLEARLEWEIRGGEFKVKKTDSGVP